MLSFWSVIISYIVCSKTEFSITKLIGTKRLKKNLRFFCLLKVDFSLRTLNENEDVY
jgi:hypothetical protein